jgi:hypothetical protein
VCDIAGNDDSSFPLEVVRDFVEREYVPTEKVQCSRIRDNILEKSAGLKRYLDSR